MIEQPNPFLFLFTLTASIPEKGRGTGGRPQEFHQRTETLVNAQKPPEWPIMDRHICSRCGMFKTCASKVAIPRAKYVWLCWKCLELTHGDPAKGIFQSQDPNRDEEDTDLTITLVDAAVRLHGGIVTQTTTDAVYFRGAP